MFQEIRDTLNGTNQRRARRNTAIGITAGVLIGAIAGLLFAPKSGKETRADIVEGVKVGEEAVKEVAHNIVEATKEKVAVIKTKFKKAVKEEAAADTEEPV